MDPTNNYPPGFDENEAVSSHRRLRHKKQPAPPAPLTNEERERQEEAFKNVDEWDRRHYGKQFNQE